MHCRSVSSSKLSLAKQQLCRCSHVPHSATASPKPTVCVAAALLDWLDAPKLHFDALSGATGPSSTYMIYVYQGLEFCSTVVRRGMLVSQPVAPVLPLSFCSLTSGAWYSTTSAGSSSSNADTLSEEFPAVMMLSSDAIVTCASPTDYPFCVENCSWFVGCPRP